MGFQRTSGFGAANHAHSLPTALALAALRSAAPHLALGTPISCACNALSELVHEFILSTLVGRHRGAVGVCEALITQVGGFSEEPVEDVLGPLSGDLGAQPAKNCFARIAVLSGYRSSRRAESWALTWRQLRGHQSHLQRLCSQIHVAPTSRSGRGVGSTGQVIGPWEVGMQLCTQDSSQSIASSHSPVDSGVSRAWNCGSLVGMRRSSSPPLQAARSRSAKIVVRERIEAVV